MSTGSYECAVDSGGPGTRFRLRFMRLRVGPKGDAHHASFASVGAAGVPALSVMSKWSVSASSQRVFGRQQYAMHRS